MKVLVVNSGNFPHPELNFPIYQAFIYEQLVALSDYNVKFEIYYIKGRGIFGYLKNIYRLRKKINSEKFDLVHAHVGYSGIIAIIASSFLAPLIITLHGSDINDKIENILISFFSCFKGCRIFVSKRLFEKSLLKYRRDKIIPCGIDLDVFFPEEMQNCRIKEGLNDHQKYVLFPAKFENKIKNSSLAKTVIKLIDDEIELVELKNRSREEVRTIINAVDVVLLTSFSEGSPQVIKEAMACNCPIVATDVGDIKKVMGDTEGCFITSFVPEEVAEKLKMALAFGGRTNGRYRIKQFDNKLIAAQVYDVYKNVVAKRKSK